MQLGQDTYMTSDNMHHHLNVLENMIWQPVRSLPTGLIVVALIFYAHTCLIPMVAQVSNDAHLWIETFLIHTEVMVQCTLPLLLPTSLQYVLLVHLFI
jgi:hypothetical protein